MNVWDWFWWMFWVFVYAAYFCVIVFIIIDIFRDRTLNGWLKAVWLVFLLFVPFLTGLVYLIVRGGSMSQRWARQQVEYPDEDVAAIRSQSFQNPADEIAKAAALRDAGTITPGEFEAIKAKALGSKF
ncbi:SHOCT domain-containing protein [Agromyces intestinalis]|uniref:SHOCT domain-containing protein n=1 Tax=Agromyces intestinalis TaxID=2592652 RepID=A0A5C1YEV6_9MICO|nr:SHOCT domain-containing protein [Agromyces intestinalis]QEO14593.1 SHOCT domain-containing protein [Agromyces intestinalis]